MRTNEDDPRRHNIGGSMNRPPRNADPLSPRNTTTPNIDAYVRDEIMTFPVKVGEILIEVETLLITKNEKYGNSALEPKRIFSKASPVEQLKVRIDDKLSRIATGTADDEDTIMDLIGYLVLLKVATDG